jgi:arginase
MVKVLTIPYDSAHRDLRMGRGPSWLVEHGALRRLEEAGHSVEHVAVEPTGTFRAEVATAFEIFRLVAASVREARAAGHFPLVLSGNCNAAVGTVAGLGAGAGVLWFDAHADCETPDTTTSGFLDGMGLATLLGRCWRGPAASVPGFRPVPAGCAALVGARQVSASERRLIEAARLPVVAVAEVRRSGVAGALQPALDLLRRRGVRQLYLHIDLDVHDPGSVAPANGYAVPGGLAADEVREAVAVASRAIPVTAAGLASFDPDHDARGRMLEACLGLLPLLAQAGGRGGGP